MTDTQIATSAASTPPVAKATTAKASNAMAKKGAAKKASAKKTAKPAVKKTTTKTTAKNAGKKVTDSDATPNVAAKKAPARKSKTKAKFKPGTSPLYLGKDEYNACIDGMMAQGLDRTDAVETLKVGIRQANGRPVPLELLLSAEAFGSVSTAA